MPTLPTAPTVVLVTCTHPASGAEELARFLVEEGLVACAQVLPGLRSIYRWQGKVEEAEEIRLELKSTRDRLPELVEAIRARHPYDVPEIVAVEATGGLAAYLDWVRESSL